MYAFENSLSLSLCVWSVFAWRDFYFWNILYFRKNESLQENSKNFACFLDTPQSILIRTLSGAQKRWPSEHTQHTQRTIRYEISQKTHGNSTQPNIATEIALSFLCECSYFIHLYTYESPPSIHHVLNSLSYIHPLHQRRVCVCVCVYSLLCAQVVFPFSLTILSERQTVSIWKQRKQRLLSTYCIHVLILLFDGTTKLC